MALKQLAVWGAAFAFMVSPAQGQEGAGPVTAEAIDWGDDASDWANDQECDDPRFEGEGMASVTEAADRFHDATDCRTLFEAGEITLISTDVAQRPPLQIDGIQFGNDTSEWAQDGECDDPRFSGAGMAGGTLDTNNAYADRTDCLGLWQAGSLTYDPAWRATAPILPSAGEIDQLDFGGDTSEWAQDGECDDPRFEGIGMAASPVMEDLKADASDCRYMFMTGHVTLRQKP
ncbi:MAG: hypothetical protein MRY64_14690 [Hyphomonadaceae bacterium]|nr:hypothetical protein [Hyphomonadaceae bacterium]